MNKEVIEEWIKSNVNPDITYGEICDFIKLEQKIRSPLNKKETKKLWNDTEREAKQQINKAFSI